MNAIEQWQTTNGNYLEAAVRWIRLLLSDRSGLSAGDTNRADTPSHETEDREDIAAAANAFSIAEQCEPPPALVILGRRLGLSSFEQKVLLLCAAMELDTRVPYLCACAQGDPNKVYPTFALAMALFDDPAWDALTPGRPLRRFRLIEIDQRGSLPLTSSPLKADERIVNYIKGLDHLDERLAPLLDPVEPPSVELQPSHEHLAESIMTCLQSRAASGRYPVVQLTGPDSGCKRHLAGVVSALCGLHLYRLSADSLPNQIAELELLIRLWERETLLSPVALYLDAQDVDAHSADTGAQTTLRRFLERCRGLIFLGTGEIRRGLAGGVAFEVSKPTPSEQLTAWQAAIGDGCRSAELLAGQFNLNSTDIDRIAKMVPLKDPTDTRTYHERLWGACISTMRPRLDSLAHRLEPKATWRDIVLTADVLSLLRRIADQVKVRNKVYERWGYSSRMNRGFGISVLFAGESGTGKTMAAEVIASDLHLDLYRIDLSGVVSKYIGETEKNLKKLFDAAEDGGSLLFFDEADALFGKRSEVKDSHDRYANIEINYLLQRMESYRGLAILATNARSALDQAFTRRLRFIVNFPFPGTVERRAIWEKAFPGKTPKAKLDIERLARLNVSGGAINNIALNAAFMAAGSEEQPVTMRLIIDAARAEFKKMEKPINEADFRLDEFAGGHS